MILVARWERYKRRYSSAEERLTPFAIHMTCKGLNCEWLSAHNREVVGSKPTTGTSSYRVHRSVRTSKTMKTSPTRCGAEEARVAHNHEVIRSKRIAGTSLYRVHRSVRTLKTKTSLAQRQSAGLIILRSADQNPQEVLVLIEFIAL